MTEALAAGPIRSDRPAHRVAARHRRGLRGRRLHFAARVAAAAHGGQVIVSGRDGRARRRRRSRRPRLPPPEGHRRARSRIYQLGDGAFPPLKTIANTNLPTPASRFLGREAELYAGRPPCCTRPDCSPFSGPGGQGKTRFALELARRAREERFSDYSDGVFACFLASLRDPALVLSTICQTLSLREEAGRSALETLVSHLEGKRMLLLARQPRASPRCRAGALASFSQRCPALTLLVTRRELLRVSRRASLRSSAARRGRGRRPLLRARRVEPSRRRSRELCARLEGLPLAIELAAAVCASSAPQQLLERLSQRLDLLKGTPRRRSPPADASSDDRVVVRPPLPEEQRSSPALRLRRRLHARSRRRSRRSRPRHARVAPRQEPASSVGLGGRPALLDARDDPGVRRRAPRDVTVRRTRAESDTWSGRESRN